MATSKDFAAQAVASLAEFLRKGTDKASVEAIVREAIDAAAQAH